MESTKSKETKEIQNNNDTDFSVDILTAILTERKTISTNELITKIDNITKEARDWQKYVKTHYNETDATSIFNFLSVMENEFHGFVKPYDKQLFEEEKTKDVYGRKLREANIGMFLLKKCFFTADLYPHIHFHKEGEEIIETEFSWFLFLDCELNSLDKFDLSSLFLSLTGKDLEQLKKRFENEKR